MIRRNDLLIADDSNDLNWSNVGQRFNQDVFENFN